MNSKRLKNKHYKLFMLVIRLCRTEYWHVSSCWIQFLFQLWGFGFLTRNKLGISSNYPCLQKPKPLAAATALPPPYARSPAVPNFHPPTKLEKRNMGWQDNIMIVSTTAKFNSNRFCGVWSFSLLKRNKFYQNWQIRNDWQKWTLRNDWQKCFIRND